MTDNEPIAFTFTPGPGGMRAIVTVTKDGTVTIADDATPDELRKCLMSSAREAARLNAVEKDRDLWKKRCDDGWTHPDDMATRLNAAIARAEKCEADWNIDLLKHTTMIRAERDMYAAAQNAAANDYRIQRARAEAAEWLVRVKTARHNAAESRADALAEVLREVRPYVCGCGDHLPVRLIARIDASLAEPPKKAE